MTGRPASDPSTNDGTAMICRVCGERIEALTVTEGREVLDMTQFRKRHARCLSASDC